MKSKRLGRKCLSLAVAFSASTEQALEKLHDKLKARSGVNFDFQTRSCPQLIYQGFFLLGILCMYSPALLRLNKGQFYK